MKDIVLLILSFLLAIALTIGVAYLLWFYFQDYDFGHGFWELLASIIGCIVMIVCNLTVLAFVACLAAWSGFVYMCKKVFGDKKSDDKPSYTRTYRNHRIPRDFEDMHGSNEDKSYLYE